MPLVSVVIPTYNRGRCLARALGALAAVDPPEGGFDVVVVDDGSDDAHEREYAAALARLPAARVIRQANAGPAAARNQGIAATEGALVAFLDDDCLPTPNWLTELVAPLVGGDETLAAVGGRVLPAPPTNWVTRFCAAVEYSSGVQPVFENAATANACYRRSVLELLDGFDESFVHPGGDDPDLSLRTRAAGFRLEFVPTAVVHHLEIESYGDFLLHWYRRGLGAALLARKHRGTRRIALRAMFLPVFLARVALLTWRRTDGKGGAVARSAWSVLEMTGQAAFVAGSLAGLYRG